MVMVMVVGVVKKEENIFNIECYLVSVKKDRIVISSLPSLLVILFLSPHFEVF